MVAYFFSSKAASCGRPRYNALMPSEIICCAVCLPTARMHIYFAIVTLVLVETLELKYLASGTFLMHAHFLSILNQC